MLSYHSEDVLILLDDGHMPPLVPPDDGKESQG